MWFCRCWGCPLSRPGFSCLECFGTVAGADRDAFTGSGGESSWLDVRLAVWVPLVPVPVVASATTDQDR